MIRDDESLRRAFQSLSKGAGFTEACPPADRLWAGARGELSSGEVEGLAVHMAECGACAEAWRVAGEFGDHAVVAAPARGLPRWLPIAAALVLAAGASLIYLSRSQPATGPDQTSAPPAPAPSPAPPSYTINVDKAPLRVSSRYALTWRGQNDGPRFLESLNQALAPYVSGEYPAAVAALAKLAGDYPDTAEPQFYLGVSRLLNGDAAGSIAPLERARELGEPDQVTHAQWYLAAAYERTARLDEARRMAQAVCDGKRERSADACAVVTKWSTQR